MANSTSQFFGIERARMIDPKGTILVTGGCGFIGSHLIRWLLNETSHAVCNVDALTYAGNIHSLQDIQHPTRYRFHHTDITDRTAIEAIIDEVRPQAVMHLAAESHVDRSIDGPSRFIQTNVHGTLTLLEATRRYLTTLSETDRKCFRFLHVSTDEVFGSLGPTGYFHENTPYDPRSPYSASKAASDHLVRAWHHTYDVPVLITNCSNNYGPYQFPEKLIPVVILNAIADRPIPVYGRGENIRDWLYVLDHVRALLAVLCRGRVGQTYAIGGNTERTNIDLVLQLCDCLDELQPKSSGSYRQQVSFVTDRPGHDLRYAINPSRIREELGWTPQHDFRTGIMTTVRWYLENRDWWTSILDGSYRLERLGQLKSTRVP